MKRSADMTERAVRRSFGCAPMLDGIAARQGDVPVVRLFGGHVRPGYLSDVSRGSAVV